MATYNVMSVPFKARGPLPEGNFGNTTYAPGSDVSARLSDAGAQLAGQAAQAQARGLDALRSGIGKVGQFALDYADMLEREDLTKAQEAYRKFQLEGQEMRRQLGQLRGKDALDGENHRNVEARMVEWSRRAKEAYGKGLGKRGSYYFNSHADTFASQQVSWAMNHRVRQSDAYRKQELSAAIDVEGENIAIDPFNQEAVSQSLGRLRGLLEQSGEVNGWSPEMVDAAFASVRTAAFKKAVSGQIMAGNIDGAQRLLQQHGGEMELQDALALRQAIGQGAMDLMRAHIQAGNPDAAEQVFKKVTATPDSRGVTPMDEMLGTATERHLGTKYKMGAKEPGLGRVDCSGWVAHSLQQAGVGGYAGKNSEQQVELAMQRGREVSLADVESNPRGGLVIGLDQGQKKHDVGRKKGIDHVVVTYRDRKTGKVMVSEASSSKGVHSVPLERWVAYHKSKGHKFYIGDISGRTVSGSPLNPAQQVQAKTIIDEGRAYEQGQKLFDAVANGDMTYGDALKKVSEMPRSMQPSVRAMINSGENVRRANEEQAVDAAYVRAGNFQNELSDLWKTDKAKAMELAQKTLRDAQAKAITGSKADKAYFEAVRKIVGLYGSGAEKKTGGTSARTSAQDRKELEERSAEGLAKYRAWFDAHPEATEAERARTRIQYGLIGKDLKAAEEYTGFTGYYKQQDIDNRVDKIAGRDTVSRANKGKIFDFLLKEAKVDGKKKEGKELDAAIYDLLKTHGFMAGRTGWLGGRVRSDALAAVGDPSFRPEVPEGTRRLIEETLLKKHPKLLNAPSELIDSLVSLEYARNNKGWSWPELTADERKTLKALGITVKEE